MINMDKKDNIKKEIKNCDDEIDKSKNKVKQLNELEEDFVLLDRSFGKYLDLLSTSVKGHKAKVILDESYEFKNKSINESLEKLSKDRDVYTNKIKEYTNNREKLEEKYKENVNNKENEDK